MRRASVTQLHALVWAMLADGHGAQMAASLSGDSTEPVPIRFDPAVARAIDLAVGLGLLARDGKRIRFEPDGEVWWQSLVSDPSLMSQEKAILDNLGTVSMVDIERAVGVGRS